MVKEGSKGAASLIKDAVQQINALQKQVDEGKELVSQKMELETVVDQLRKDLADAQEQLDSCRAHDPCCNRRSSEPPRDLPAELEELRRTSQQEIDGLKAQLANRDSQLQEEIDGLKAKLANRDAQLAEHESAGLMKDTLSAELSKQQAAAKEAQEEADKLRSE
eukprot:TRINITY_DN57036_c0_g1_i1.p2 TRINITY_DN57036_c0_g1~~TRINITY_DN57036_c0_g1_i1.p2  ORF type:complete len:164 (-),score=54.60 TRINITY_DN57036_c0_g1_i1:114-605(-)